MGDVSCHHHLLCHCPQHCNTLMALVTLMPGAQCHPNPAAVPFVLI